MQPGTCGLMQILPGPQMSAGTGQLWLREKKCSLMQTMSWPAVRALKSTLRQLVNSHTVTYSTVDVL